MARRHVLMAAAVGAGILLGGCSGSPDIDVPQAIECQLTYRASPADVAEDETVRVERSIGEDGDVDTAVFGQGREEQMDFLVSYHASSVDNTLIQASVGTTAGDNLVGIVTYSGDVPDGPLIGPDEEIHGDATLGYVCEGSA